MAQVIITDFALRQLQNIFDYISDKVSEDISYVSDRYYCSANTTLRNHSQNRKNNRRVKIAQLTAPSFYRKPL